MSPDKLAYMANQIGKFFAHQGEEKTVAGIADHLEKFWDPRMRKTILEYAAGDGAGLQPAVLKAIQRLKPENRSNA